MALLPFGLKPFRFLFSSDINNKDLFSTHRHFQVKPFTLMAFTSHETDEFLSDVIPEKNLYVHSTIPHLVVCRSYWQVSVARSSLIQILSIVKHLIYHTILMKFLEAEWDLLTPMSEETEAALSFLLAYGGPVSVEQLLSHIKLSESELSDQLSRFPFLSISKNLGDLGFHFRPFPSICCNQTSYKGSSSN